MSTLAVADWAVDLAGRMLAPLGNRWLHAQGVGARARAIAPAFDQADRDVLIAAAYLHDIGYAPSLIVTGFHPVDGAQYLRLLGYERLACLVAYHSESQFEAAFRGLTSELAVFPRERSAVADALTYCDQLTNSLGKPVSFQLRHADILARYAPDSVVCQANREALSRLALAVGRTKKRITKYGVSE